MTAGEIQAYIKSGAHLTKDGFRWDKNLRKAYKQIECYAFIRGLQAALKFHHDWDHLMFV